MRGDQPQLRGNSSLASGLSPGWAAFPWAAGVGQLGGQRDRVPRGPFLVDPSQCWGGDSCPGAYVSREWGWGCFRAVHPSRARAAFPRARCLGPQIPAHEGHCLSLWEPLLGAWLSLRGHFSLGALSQPRWRWALLASGWSPGGGGGGDAESWGGFHGCCVTASGGAAPRVFKTGVKVALGGLCVSRRGDNLTLGPFWALAAWALSWCSRGCHLGS